MDLSHEYWKHVRCQDVFFKPKRIFPEKTAESQIVYGHWMTQAINCWFFAPVEVDRFRITAKEMPNWQPYTPRGRIKL